MCETQQGRALCSQSCGGRERRGANSAEARLLAGLAHGVRDVGRAAASVAPARATLARGRLKRPGREPGLDRLARARALRGGSSVDVTHVGRCGLARGSRALAGVRGRRGALGLGLAGLARGRPLRVDGGERTDVTSAARAVCAVLSAHVRDRTSRVGR